MNLGHASITPEPEYVPVQTTGVDPSRFRARVISTSKIPAGDAIDSLTVGEIVGVILKNWLVVSLCIVVAVSLAVLYCFVASPKYTAVAKVRIATYLPLLSGAERENVIRQQTAENEYFATQMENMRSLPLADRVISVDEVRDDILKTYPLFFGEGPQVQDSPEYHYPSGILRHYFKMIGISQVGETSLVTVSVTSKNPHLSALLANTHAREFIQGQIDGRKAIDVSNINLLKSRVKDLSQKLARAEDGLTDYANTHAFVSMDSDSELLLEKIKDAQRLLTFARGERIKSESRLQETQKALVGKGPKFLDDDNLDKLRVELGSVKTEYAELSEQFTPEYPRMKSLRGRMSQLETQIEEQRKAVLANLETELRSAGSVEDKMIQDLETARLEIVSMTRSQLEYTRMKREYESLKDLHQNVVVELQRLELSAEGTWQENISIAEPAVVPDSPTSPNKVLAVFLALFGGTFVGVGWAFLKELTDKTVKSPSSAVDLLPAPAIGLVPTISHSPVSALASKRDSDSGTAGNYRKSDELLVTLREPFGLESESFRTIRAEIKLASQGEQMQVFLITSARPEAGKSTIAANLGVVFGQDNSRVLLIDADLRNSSLSPYFGLPDGAKGLTEVLSGTLELDDVIKETHLGSLSFLPAGRAVPNPAELIGSKMMNDLISKLRERFDFIIIDSPPILPVADSLLLSRLVDEVLYVVRVNSTLRNTAQEGYDRLVRGGAHVLGVIFNAVTSEEAGGQYGQNYGSRLQFKQSERIG